MLKTKFLRYLVVILSLCLSAKSYSQTEDGIEEAQYSINYVVDGNEKEQLVSHLNIHLKDNAKIFVKNKPNEETQTRVTLENKHNIRSVEIKWPAPTQSTNDAFYYTEDINVPISIKLIDPPDANLIELFKYNMEKMKSIINLIIYI